VDRVKKINIVKVTGGGREAATDVVAVEKPISIYVNSEFYASITCTPSDLRELAAGCLFSRGMLSDPQSIRSIEEMSGDSIWVSLDSEGLCDSGVSPVEAAGKFNAEELLSLMREFNSRSEIFRETGGVHSCALCAGGRIEAFFEDVGRHNATDKVIGHALLNGIELGERFLMTSGRISADTISKLARAGIQMAVSRSAPTDLALEIAEAANITVAGFARGSSMNIYCGEQRIS
jgi:FdhD protein